MDYEVISRLLYLKLIEDGTRVDRVRALVIDLKETAGEVYDLSSRKLLKKIVKQIETALMDTPKEQLRLQRKKIEIERLEQAMAERQLPATRIRPDS